MQQLKQTELKKVLYAKYGICHKPQNSEIWLLTDAKGQGQELSLGTIKNGVNRLLNEPRLNINSMLSYINTIGSV